MEWKIGEIRQIKGEWYQCINPEIYGCSYCDLQNKCIDDIKGKVAACHSRYRSDKKCVVFKKLEKVGESYEHCGKLYQCYKLPMEIEIGLPPNNCNPIGKDNLVEVEIKQNQEDMEEKKLNLKPFDIQKAREGKPVCTRDGRKARIICFDKKGGSPVIALVETFVKEYDCIREDSFYYTVEGRAVGQNTESKDDLMMLPERKEGWVNVYKGGLLDTKSYNTKKEAFDKACPKDYVDTVKINWEE